MTQEHITTITVLEENGRPRAIPNHRITNAGPSKKSDMTLAPLETEASTGKDWAEWGEADDYPTMVREKFEKVPVAGRTVQKLVAMMMGDGLCYYNNGDITDGSTRPPRAYSPGPETWIRRNKLNNKYLLPSFGDYRLLMNSFQEAILDRKENFIPKVFHLPAEFCRVGRQTERNMYSERLYFSPDFSYRVAPAKSRRREIPLLPWHDVEDWADRFRGKKFAYHTRYETPGIKYYATSWWNGLYREGGWMDASIRVPEIVNAMQNNQIVLKYQILIPETYFKIMYSNWDMPSEFSDERKRKIINDLISEIEEALADSKNWFKSISTVFREDQQGNPIGKVEIKAIDDKIKKDSWVPSAEKSDLQIITGHGEHPSQIGLGASNDRNAGSGGSDQRESYNTGINLNTIDQNINLEFLQMVADFNARGSFRADAPIIRKDWDITFYFAHTYHTTTNKQESGEVKSDDTINPQQ